MGTRLSASLSEQLKKGVAILKQGGVIAFPTDTVYGLGAAIDRDAAVARVYRIKERPKKQALPLILADIAQLESVASVIPTYAIRLGKRFWPGPLTLVLPKSAAVSDIISNSPTVAVRVPNHPIATALLQGVGRAITGTSANLSGQPSALTAAGVRQQLGDRVDFIIEGDCPGGKESTIVDLSGETPVILRESAISREELRQICPEIKVKGG